MSDHDTGQAAAAEAARLNGCPVPTRGVDGVLDALARLNREDLTRLSDADLLALRGNLSAWQALADLEDFERQQARARRADGCRLAQPVEG